jgi:protoheme IX farnesyltransferase
MDYKAALQRYYRLSKPGIVYANTMTAAAGYLYASELHISWMTLIGLVVGIAALISGACAYNNYIDRHIDAVMRRTKKRGLVTGDITGRAALVYATAMTIGSLALLAVSQNRLVVVLSLIAFIDYVVLYGWSKRHTVHGTLVGTICGSLPIVIGYVAVTGRLDTEAWLLFGLMVAWQMAHFYAIALYRTDDYRQAGIPVMPVVYGAATTKLQTVAYIALFIVLSACLFAYGNIGVVAGLVLGVLGVWWLVKALIGYRMAAPDAWGKQVFFASLTVLLGMSLCLVIGPIIS